MDNYSFLAKISKNSEKKIISAWVQTDEQRNQYASKLNLFRLII
jgi:hypothetical protein